MLYEHFIFVEVALCHRQCYYFLGTSFFKTRFYQWIRNATCSVSVRSLLVLLLSHQFDLQLIREEAARRKPIWGEIDVNSWLRTSVTQPELVLGGFFGPENFENMTFFIILPWSTTRTYGLFWLPIWKVGFKCCKMFSEHPPSQISDCQSLILQHETFWERTTSCIDICIHLWNA